MDFKKLKGFTPGNKPGLIETIDMHTEGEPLRVIVGGLPQIKGSTILEKRRFFKDNYDHS